MQQRVFLWVVLCRLTNAVNLASQLLFVLEMVAHLVAISDSQEDLLQCRNRDAVSFNAKRLQPLIKFNEKLFEERSAFDGDLKGDFG